MAAEEGLKSKHSIILPVLTASIQYTVASCFFFFYCYLLNSFLINYSGLTIILNLENFVGFTSIHLCSQRFQLNVTANNAAAEKKSTPLNAKFMYVLYEENNLLLRSISVLSNCTVCDCGGIEDLLYIITRLSF